MENVKSHGGPRTVAGVSLCVLGLLGFVATNAVLSSTRSGAACGTALQSNHCHWPPLWALFVGVCGTLGSFALVVTGLLMLLVSVATAREERTLAYLGSRRTRLRPSAAPEPH